VGAYRGDIDENSLPETIGGNYKDAMAEPGGWKTYMYMQGETIPKETNHVRLSKDQKDQWGRSALYCRQAYSGGAFQSELVQAIPYRPCHE